MKYTGSGYLDHGGYYEKKTTYYLTSISVKILSVVMTIVISSLTIVFIIYRNQVPWYIVSFMVLLTCLLVFFSIIFFLNRITIDLCKQIIKIQSTQFYIFNLQDVQRVEVDTNFSLNKNKYCFIIFKMKNSKIYKLSGYSSLSNKNSVQKSRNIISEIQTILNEYNLDDLE